MNIFLPRYIKSKTPSFESIHRQVGKLTISVDPRMELLCAIQGISDYQHIQRNNSYFNTVKSYFSSSADLQAIPITNKLAGLGFSYDAPVAFMLYLTYPNECKPRLPYSDYLIKRAQGEQHLSEYQEAIHEFAVETKFDRFWEQRQSFYNRMIDLNNTISCIINVNYSQKMQ